MENAEQLGELTGSADRLGRRTGRDVYKWKVV